MGVKIADGQALHALEQLRAEAAHGALADVDHDAVVGVGAEDAGAIDERNGGQRRRQDDDGRQEDHAQLHADEKAHGHAANEHQRRAHRDPQDHLAGVLHVGHIGGHPGDKAGGAVAVDVGEGEGLHLLINPFPQVAGQAGGRLCRVPAGQDAARQAQQSHGQHDAAI